MDLFHQKYIKVKGSGTGKGDVFVDEFSSGMK